MKSPSPKVSKTPKTPNRVPKTPRIPKRRNSKRRVSSLLNVNINSTKNQQKNAQQQTNNNTSSHWLLNPLRNFFSETWLLSQLTVELLHDLGSRGLWVWMMIKFCIYVVLFSFAFWRVAFIFLVSDYIKRNIRYGPNGRNLLDIYFASKSCSKYFQHKNSSQKNNSKGNDKNSENSNNKRSPVVIFVTGGAWIIGYKAWGAVMGMLLAQLGVIFVSPDYRNFPQGTISDMVNDVTLAINWVFEHIEEYGGDRENIYLISQSAGAHICCLTLLIQAKKCSLHKINMDSQKTNESKSKTVYTTNTTTTKTKHSNIINTNKCNKKNEKLKETENILWDPCKLRAWIGIAGPYNMVDMKDFLNSRGLYADILDKIMENDLEKYSPFYVLHDYFKPNITNHRRLKSMSNLLDINQMSLVPFVSMTKLIDFDQQKTSKKQKICYDDYREERINELEDEHEHEFEDEFENDDITTDSDSDKEDVNELNHKNNNNSISRKLKNLLFYKNNKNFYLTRTKSSSSILSVISICEEKELELNKLNGDTMMNNLGERKVELNLCPVYLFHGGQDTSCPSEQATIFGKILAKFGIETYLKIYPSKTHTGPIIEDPIEGNDALVCDILKVIYPDESLGDIVNEIEDLMRGSLRYPKWIISTARFVCPF